MSTATILSRPMPRQIPPPWSRARPIPPLDLDLGATISLQGTPAILVGRTREAVPRWDLRLADGRSCTNVPEPVLRRGVLHLVLAFHRA